MKKLALALLFLACAAVPAHAAPVPEAAALGQRYGLQVVTADGPGTVRSTYGPITFDAPSAAGTAAYLPLLLGEFGLYPPDLVRNTGLKRLVLCTNLVSRGVRVTALPAYEEDALYYDVERPASPPAYLRKVIHHEFYHWVDYRDDGELYADPAWAALNPAGHKYGAGGRSRLGDPNQTLLTKAYPGFLTAYGTAGVEEDKAELFAVMMLDPAYVTDRAWEDGVLKLKVARMKALLATFAPGVNEGFWSGLAYGRER